MIALEHHPHHHHHHHQARNRKEPLIPKQTDEDDEMIEVLSVVGDVTSIMTIDAKSFVEVATGGGGGSGVSSPSDGSTSSGIRPRKRAKLDHLSSDEKAQHRKMMNRISAQSARDRQKCLMQQQEIEIKSLVSVNETLKSENQVLSSKCVDLVAENERLSKLLSQYEQKTKSSATSTVLEPVIKKEHIEDTSEVSGKLEKDVDSSLEPAVPRTVPLPKGPELLKNFSYLLLLWTCLQWTLTHQSSSKPLMTLRNKFLAQPTSCQSDLKKPSPLQVQLMLQLMKSIRVKKEPG